MESLISSIPNRVTQHSFVSIRIKRKCTLKIPAEAGAYWGEDEERVAKLVPHRSQRKTQNVSLLQE